MSEPLEYIGQHDTAFGRTAPAGDAFTGTVFEDWNGDETSDGWGTKTDLAERKMQDGLEKNADGSVSFAAVKVKGWHGLGTVFDRPMSALDMLKAANADYDVFKIPDGAIVLDDAGKVVQTIIDPDKMKTARRNPVTGEIEILGTVTPKYPVFSNRDSFVGFGDALARLAEHNVATCGVTHGGRRAFMSWKLGKDILVGGEDASELWLLVSTSHDGSQPLRAAVTPLRTVCVNTCRWNWRNAITSWTIKHTPNAKLAVADAQNSLKLSFAYAEEWQKRAEAMISAKLTDDAFAKIVEANFGPGEDAKPTVVTKWEAKKARLMDLFTTADTQANCRNTAWAGLNAIGEFQDWGLKVNAPAWDGNEDGYRFARSLWEEKTTHRPKEIAFRIFSEYAGVAA